MVQTNYGNITSFRDLGGAFIDWERDLRDFTKEENVATGTPPVGATKGASLVRNPLLAGVGLFGGQYLQNTQQGREVVDQLANFEPNAPGLGQGAKAPGDEPDSPVMALLRVANWVINHGRIVGAFILILFTLIVLRPIFGIAENLTD